jgi:hypothetical protein
MVRPQFGGRITLTNETVHLREYTPWCYIRVAGQIVEGRLARLRKALYLLLEQSEQCCGRLSVLALRRMPFCIRSE